MRLGRGATRGVSQQVANVSRAMAKKLVIVESPAKAKTIAGYLGSEYDVESSIGHIRDLPNRASDVPKEKRAKYGTMGVAIQEDFEPYYIVDPDKKAKVSELKKKLKDADELLLATDEDREGRAFVSADYWDITGTFDPGTFEARLAALDGQRVAQGRDFTQQGELKSDDLARLDEAAARGLAGELEGLTFTVRSSDEKPYTRRPAAPFMTSTLQQEASRKLRFSAQTTMRVAQRLYENGYITYMRTDSTTLSESALAAARRQAVDLYGADSIPDAPRRYARKVKNAQEAHEAIRPAGDFFRTPKQLERELNRDELALYDLIWKRTLASQMADARGLTVSLRLGTATPSGRDAEFAASGTVITFRGFLAAYEESRDDETEKEEERPLPHLKPGDELKAVELEPEGHATTAPARYTEASLVQALEERGIGRPSTYASIIGTILDRGYVFKRGTALVPSFLAFAVTGLLEQHFGRLVDYSFTAQMEDDLDRIAAGEQERVDWLRHFYFGGDGEG